MEAATRFPVSFADDLAGVVHHAPEVRRTWASGLRHGTGGTQLPRGHTGLTKTTESSACPI
jgi:hypothetical protein